MKINEDLLFILTPSSMWDDSHTSSIQKIITVHGEHSTGANWGELKLGDFLSNCIKNHNLWFLETLKETLNQPTKI